MHQSPADLPPIFWAALLCISAIGGTLAYLYEKRHPYFKPGPDSLPRPPVSLWESMRPFVVWCLKIIVGLAGFAVALFVLVKLIKWAWYY
jgi:hypothetical protein